MILTIMKRYTDLESDMFCMLQMKSWCIFYILNFLLSLLYTANPVRDHFFFFFLVYNYRGLMSPQLSDIQPQCVMQRGLRWPFFARKLLFQIIVGQRKYKAGSKKIDGDSKNYNYLFVNSRPILQCLSIYR